MIIAATGLILLGGFSALLGFKIFRLLLPLIGFVSGVMVGFGGVQGVFGTGVVSLTVAIIMAVVVGTIMAILSFMFFEIAIAILMGMLGAAVLTFLGSALGLEDAGVVMGLLAIAGFVIGLVVATNNPISGSLVVVITSMVGVAFILASIMLIFGEVTLDQLNDEGILRTVGAEIDQSFIWLIVWLGGSLLAINAQNSTRQVEFMNEMYAFEDESK